MEMSAFMIQCVKLPRLWPLALGSHPVGKDFAEVHPDNRALREAEGADEADQHPDQQALVAAGGENRRHAGERKHRAHRPDQQQRSPAQLVDDRHGDDRKYQVGGAHGDRLEVSGYLAESRAREDIVQIIEDRVDP